MFTSVLNQHEILYLTLSNTDCYERDNLEDFCLMCAVSSFLQLVVVCTIWSHFIRKAVMTHCVLG